MNSVGNFAGWERRAAGVYSQRIGSGRAGPSFFSDRWAPLARNPVKFTNPRISGKLLLFIPMVMAQRTN